MSLPQHRVARRIHLQTNTLYTVFCESGTHRSANYPVLKSDLSQLPPRRSLSAEIMRRALLCPAVYLKFSRPRSRSIGSHRKDEAVYDCALIMLFVGSRRGKTLCLDFLTKAPLSLGIKSTCTQETRTVTHTFMTIYADSKFVFLGRVVFICIRSGVSLYLLKSASQLRAWLDKPPLVYSRSKKCHF